MFEYLVSLESVQLLTAVHWPKIQNRYYPEKFFVDFMMRRLEQLYKNSLSKLWFLMGKCWLDAPLEKWTRSRIESASGGFLISRKRAKHTIISFFSFYPLLTVNKLRLQAKYLYKKKIFLNISILKITEWNWTSFWTILPTTSGTQK